jgi:hypothetical protein
MIVLEGYGVNLPVSILYNILGRSQVAKYIPGNIFQYLGRVSLGKSAGISVDIAIKSIITENIFILVSLITIISTVILSDLCNVNKLIGSVNIGGAGVIFLGLLGILILLSRTIRDNIIESILFVKSMKFKTIFYLTIMWSVVYVILGLFQYLIMKYFWETSFNLAWYNVIWRYAFAWLMGYIMPGAPGGLGVRDSLFFLSIKGHIDEPIALGVTVISRILTISGEICSYAMLSILFKERGSN